MTAPLTQPQRERLDRLTELIAVLILSAAALISSYASFQAALWDGEQAAHYTLAQQSRTEASTDANMAAQVRMLDVLIFSQWLNASTSGDNHAERFYRDRFRPAFQKAFNDWMTTSPATNSKAPRTPFEMKSYVLPIDDRTRQHTAQADREFDEGQKANDISDAFTQGTVILALTLFLGGVVQAFNQLPIRIAVLGLAALCCILGIVRIIALPALRLTF